jgi:transposase
MIQVPQIDEIKISPEEWASTPVRIQQVIEHLVSENQALKASLSLIEEQLHQNSQNSSRPPSQDGFEKKTAEVKDKSKKKRGGQTGHPGTQPKFYELSDGDVIENHVPKICGLCGEDLTGEEASPYRHQILELPSLRPQITEHRFHQLGCAHCGTLTRAKLPDTVGVSRYGKRLCCDWIATQPTFGGRRFTLLFGVTILGAHKFRR